MACEPAGVENVLSRLVTRPSSPPNGNGMLLERLRAETRPLHARIEDDLAAMRVHDLLDRHALLLARFFGFYEVWEPRLGACLGDEAFFGPRRKLHLLERDLATLGHDPKAIRALPRCPRLPPLASTAQAMGSFYVLEGATLGGQVISRRLERSLGLSGGRGYSFFRSYGREVGPMWKAFGERLLETSSAAGEDACIRSAQTTFARLHLWLCRGI
jgi:heme oxygenase